MNVGKKGYRRSVIPFWHQPRLIGENNRFTRENPSSKELTFRWPKLRSTHRVEIDRRRDDTHYLARDQGALILRICESI